MATKCSFASARLSSSSARGASLKTYFPLGSFAGCFASAGGALAPPADFVFASLSASFLESGVRSRRGEASSASICFLSFRVIDAQPENLGLADARLEVLQLELVAAVDDSCRSWTNGISGSPLRSLIRFSALSSNRMSAARSRAGGSCRPLSAVPRPTWRHRRRA